MAYYTHTKNLIEVKSPSDAPKGAAFVLIMFDSRTFYTEGDERSRQCPGHGYPASSETVSTNRIYVTENELGWTDAIQGLIAEDPHRKDLLFFKTYPKPTVKVEVQIG